MAPGSHHSAKDRTLRASHSRPEAPAPGAIGCCREEEGSCPGPGPLGPHPSTPPAGARGLRTLNPKTRLPDLHPPSPTSARGSGVRKSASSRAPLRTGSGWSASTSSIRSAAGSSWQRLLGSGSPLPDLRAPPPAGCMPRGPPGGGGAGAHPAAAACDSRSSGLSGQLHPVACVAHCSRPSHHLVNQIFSNSQVAISWGSYKTSDIQATHSLGGFNLGISTF